MKVEVVKGPAKITIENDSIENIEDLLAVVSAEFGLTGNETPTVNGAPANRSSKLSDGDQVGFTKPVGQKGS